MNDIIIIDIIAFEALKTIPSNRERILSNYHLICDETRAIIPVTVILKNRHIAMLTRAERGPRIQFNHLPVVVISIEQKRPKKSRLLYWHCCSGSPRISTV